MIDLTLEEKMNYSKDRSAREAAEVHFYEKYEPFFPKGFSVGYRNPGHWDVYAEQHWGESEAFLASGGISTTQKNGDQERAFRIRGEKGDVVVFDERWNPKRPHPREALKFKSVLGAMLYIVEELMQDPADLETNSSVEPAAG